MTSDPAYRVREVLIFFVGPAESVLVRFEAHLRRADVDSFARTPWSLAVASPDHATRVPRVMLGSHSPGPGTMPLGGAQLALVPVQALPETLRGWLTWVEGDELPSAVEGAVRAFIDDERDTSREVHSRISVAESRVNVGLPADAPTGATAWETHAANILAALRATGVADSDATARLAEAKRRWERTQRRAAHAVEEEPPTA